MKKIKCLCILILCMVFFAGCSKKTDVEASTLFIEKKGNIISVDVEELDKEYYDASELEDYISEHMEEYNEANDGDVEKASFDVKDGVAKLMMEYGSYEDYAKFNGVELYSGTALKAQAEGYDFDVKFYAPKEGGDGLEEASKEDVLAHEDVKAVIIQASLNVQVPGEVLYVSSKDVKLVGKDTVSIAEDLSKEEAALTYIIYK